MSATSDALRQIRHLEVAMAQRIQQVREQEAAALAATRAEAELEMTEARTRGRAAAHKRYSDAVDAARQAAAEVVDGAQAEAAALQTEAAPHMAAAVEAVVDLLLSPPREKGK